MPASTGEIKKALREHLGGDVEWKIGYGLSTGGIAQHHAGGAAAGVGGHIADTIRAAFYVLRGGPHIVHEHVDRRRHGGAAGYRGQRQGDEVGAQPEVALRLKAADADRPRPGEPAVDGVAERDMS